MRLCYCYYRLGRGDRMMDFLRTSNIDVLQLYGDLLAAWPALADDGALLAFVKGFENE
jgi:hypothetical protein